jgi:hypothetical protein
MVHEACRFRATPMDVTEWLRGLGLEQYAPAFRDNDIDGEILRRLTADRPDLARRLTIVREPRRLPAVLSVEEVTLLFEAGWS